MTTTIDVGQGEIVPADVQNSREEDGTTFDVTTVRRSYGGGGGGKTNKSTDYIGFLLLVRLNKRPDGRVHIGERSSPAEISAEFPGVSKRDFKKVRAGEREQHYNNNTQAVSVVWILHCRIRSMSCGTGCFVLSLLLPFFLRFVSFRDEGYRRTV